VEQACRLTHKRLNLACLAADPWQAELMLQRLALEGVPVVQVAFVPAALKAMASAVLEAFRERNIDLYPDPDLLTDLRGIKAVEKGYGVRLESPRGPGGHGDVGTAFSLALFAARGGGGAAAAGVPEGEACSSQ
jgi:CubicO group peptidase (beta-lactamase class C family)